MSWQAGEVWLDTDVLWFREQRRAPFVAPAFDAETLGLVGPVATGLEASRRRRLAAKSARRRRRVTRTVPAVALVLGSATMLPLAALRNGGAGAMPLPEDPPSLILRSYPFALSLPAPRQASEQADAGSVAWRHATSAGLPYAGHLVGGTQLPVEGPDWVTWDPATDSSPNLPGRLFGNEHTIRAVLTVLAGYRAANPDAPRVVVGDISRRGGGWMNEHVSHQNGLDVDVYYPRLDRRLSAPISAGQVDRRLAQDLVDRFVAAGAQMIFVGYSTGLHGPGGVVIPYANHENHMHVRFPHR